jgi:uncharacterized repeat protein (TIGR04042 family)
MPEVHFVVRWPDSSVQECYSPSRVIEEQLQTERDYELGEFLERARTALHLASERVRAKYGFTCSSALDQLGELETKVQSYLQSSPQGLVRVLSFRRADAPRTDQGNSGLEKTQ